MNDLVTGPLLILLGILYYKKPNLFKRWFWKKTSIAQRMLDPEAHDKYMRFMGMVLMVGGTSLFMINLGLWLLKM